MRGPDFTRPDEDTVAILSRASTATVQTIMKRLGVRRIWMPLFPLEKGMRCVGPALTIRSVPGREDVAPVAYEPGTLFPGHPDDAIDAIQPGDGVVLDGRGAVDEGLFGDLLDLGQGMDAPGRLRPDTPLELGRELDDKSHLFVAVATLFRREL